jgi:acetolactate synthase-1/2/3 large subunit
MMNNVNVGELSGADSLLKTLVNCDVEVCFANPGTSEMHFVRAIDKIQGIRAVLGLFEGVVTGAADGYARMTGKPAATLLHLGPGLANGMANLHNARKAQVPMVNIIGNHATTHQRFDAPLTSDVTALANAASHWVVACRGPKTLAADAARAVQAAQAPPGHIASVIVPADAAWLPAERPASRLPVIKSTSVSDTAIAQSLAALRSGDQVSFLLRGDTLRGVGLQAAGRIASATGARLFCDTFAPRLERGAGRVPIHRMPYRAASALDLLKGTKTLILVGTQAPISFFAYPNQPSELTPEGCELLVLAHPHEDGGGALEALAEALGAKLSGEVSQRENFALPTDGTLTAESIMQIIAHYLPENAIVSDEGVTASLPYYGMLQTTAPHDHLNLTGGSIGGGLPVATGAAIACPDRKVFALEGDGSAMYTLQALWTQAREKLDVTTILYANRSYKVLVEELKIVGAGQTGTKALSMLDLHDPTLNWVKLAEGMGVEAVRVEDTRSLADVLQSAVIGHGPRLIEAVV